MRVTLSLSAALFSTSAVLVTLVACSSGSSDPPSQDAGPVDASHPTPGFCYPVAGDTGNALNVGAFCTKGGGQCSAYGNSLLQCSSDLSPIGGNFCLVIGCTADSDCGEDGCCTGQAGGAIKACIPNGCFDGGICNVIAPTG